MIGRAPVLEKSNRGNLNGSGRLTGFKISSCSRMWGWEYAGNRHACDNPAVFFAHTAKGTFFFCEDCAILAQKQGFTLNLHRII